MVRDTVSQLHGNFSSCKPAAQARECGLHAHPVSNTIGTGASFPFVSQKSLPSPISRSAGLPSPLLDLASRFCDRTPRCLQSFGCFPKIAMHVATSLLKQFRPCVMQFIEDLIACHC